MQTENLDFKINYPPSPQQRHRNAVNWKGVVAAITRALRGRRPLPTARQLQGFVWNYDPSGKKKKEFLLLCLQHAPKSALQGPLRVDLAFYIGRPKSHYRTGKYSHLLKDMHLGSDLHTKKPDIDNLRKFVMDALNGKFWIDDCQICKGETEKYWYSGEGYIKILITQLNKD